MKTAALSDRPEGAGSDTPHTVLLDSAQRQLDALRDAVDIRLSALDDVLQDPSRIDVLESLILDLSRLATEEAQATAARACMGMKIDADTQIAHARKTFQSTLEEERHTSAGLRTALDQAQDRILALTRQHETDVSNLRDQFESRLTDERTAAAEIQEMAAELERSLSATQAVLASEQEVAADLRAAIEAASDTHASLTLDIERLERAGMQQTADLSAEQQRLSDEQHAHAETQTQLAAARATGTELRGAMERARETFQTGLEREQQRVADLERARQEAEALLGGEQEEAAALRGEIDRGTEQLAGLAAQIESARVAHDTLATELRHERERVSDLQNDNRDAASRLESEATRHEALRKDLEAATARLTAAEDRESEALVVQTALQQELQREHARGVQLEDENKTAAEHLRSEQAHADDLKCGLARAEERLAAVNRGEQEAVAALQSELNAERANRQTLRQQLDEAERRLSSAAEQHEAQDAGQAALRHELQCEREHRAQLEREKKALEGLRGEQDALTAVQSELDAERASRQSLQQQCEKIEQQLSSVTEGHREQKANHRELQRELLAARDEAQTTRTDLQAALSRVDELIAVQTAADKACDGLNKSLETITRERDLLLLDLEVARQPLSAPEANDPVEPPDASREDKKSTAKGRKAKQVPPEPATPAKEPAAGKAAAPRQVTDDGWTAIPLATRYALPTKFEVQVNGNAGWLCDLSVTGCQILAPDTLKPGQPIKLLLPCEPKPLLCVGKVVWAQLEPPATGRALAYRAGVQFTKADESAVEQFTLQHGTSI